MGTLFELFPTDFVTWIVTFYQFMLAVTGVCMRQTMFNQSRAPGYGCVITSLLASVVSGDQCLHVEYNRLYFLFSSFFLSKDSHLAIFFANIRIFLELETKL